MAEVTATFKVCALSFLLTNAYYHVKYFEPGEVGTKKNLLLYGQAKRSKKFTRQCKFS